MIFLTVGTLFDFDRFVKAVDDAVKNGFITDTVFAQINEGKYIPRHMDYVTILNKKEFDRKLMQADFVLSHAGIGSISLAFNNNKPVLVMPRLRKYGEHVNNHQLHTAKRLEALGHVLVAVEAEELPEKIKQLKTFNPKHRKNQVDKVAERIKQFLNDGQG